MITEKCKGEIIKRYIHRDKMVIIAKVNGSYTFRVSSKANQKDYYSDKYASREDCERDSYKVARGV